MFRFSPPGILEKRGKHPLFGRLLIRQGVSLLKVNGLYRQVRFPSEEEIAAADVAYLGGYVYDIDDVEADALTDAGYGDWVMPTVTAYGEGAYGEGPYGGVWL